MKYKCLFLANENTSYLFLITLYVYMHKYVYFISFSANKSL